MLRRLLTNKIYKQNVHLAALNKNFNSSNTNNSDSPLDLNKYHEISDDTLDELTEKLESILEERYDNGADVSLNSGVLTVVVDNNNTFVINKQTPNRQIWLSSPLSGPMRFDFTSGKWIEKNTKTELKQLLSKELSQLLKNKVEC